MNKSLHFVLARLGGILLLAATLLAAHSATAQWVAQVSGLPQDWGVNSISIVDASNAWATAQDDSANNPNGTNPNTTYIRTTNGGTTWTVSTVAAATGLTVQSVTATSPTTAWMAFDDNNDGGGRLYYTTDGGTTWTRQLSTGFTSAASFLDGVVAFSPTQAVAVGDPAPGTSFEIYTTTNAGATWTAVPGPARLNASEYGFNTTLVTVPGASPAAGLCWLGTSGGRVLRSTNSGTTWSVAATGLAAATALAFSDANNGIATDNTTSATSGKVAITTDGGATWNVVTPSGPFYPPTLAGVPGQPKTFVSLGFDSTSPNGKGSSYSTNNGLTWTAIDTQQHFAAAFLNATTGYSGGIATSPTSPGGIYRGSLPAAALATATPRPLAGLAVYPNPASSYFTVAVPAVADAAQVQAALYNALGQLVAHQEASLPATGRQLSFPATGLAPGLYTLRVQAGQTAASQPLSVR